MANDAKRSLAVAADGIQLMAAFGTVEIQLSIRVHIAEGHGIGVACIPGDGQDAGCALLQYLDALFRRQQLLAPAHGTEHRDFHSGAVCKGTDPQRSSSRAALPFIILSMRQRRKKKRRPGRRTKATKDGGGRANKETGRKAMEKRECIHIPALCFL